MIRGIRRYLAILFLFVVGVLFAFLALVRSPTVIIPPHAPANPVMVHVADYGLHSRLILPDGDQRWVQYAYGDWRYFALYQRDLLTTLEALFIPTPGALGTQTLVELADLQNTFGAGWRDRLVSFSAPGNQVAQLAQLLRDRFNRNIDTLIFNPESGLSLVQDDQDYTVFHNSNHELVEWLKYLDVQVKGFITWPNLQLDIESSVPIVQHYR